MISRILKNAIVILDLLRRLVSNLIQVRFTRGVLFWDTAFIIREFHSMENLGSLLGKVESKREKEKIESEANYYFWESKHEKYIDLKIERFQNNIDKSISKTIIVGNAITKSIGHLAHFADVAKAKQLGLSKFEYVIVPTKKGNSWLLDKYIASFFPVIEVSNFVASAIERDLCDSVLDISIAEVDGSFKQYAKAHNEIERCWRSQFHDKPLLNLSKEDVLYGREFLSSLGLRQKDKFITLHTRNSNYDKHRNTSNLNVYHEALDQLFDEGYAVVRIGEGTRDPILETKKRFFDYANSSNKNERLDIILLALNQFHIGCSSGPAEVPPLFGAPVLRVDGTRLGSNLFKPNSIELPKILIGNKASNDNYQYFSEQLKRGWLDVDHAPIGLPSMELRNCSSDEITSAVKEMIVQDVYIENDVQKKISDELRLHGIHPTTTVSKNFALKHSDYFLKQHSK